MRKQAGFGLFAALSALALIKLLRQPVPGHYRVFAGAGHAIWNGLDPYGSDFGTGVGYFFYSPICALTVFGPLSALPEKLGLIAYMALSWVVFVWGASAFWRAFAPGLDEARAHRGLQWFWVAVSPQMFGGILASKLEVLISGMLLLGLAGLKEGGRARTVVACALIATALNWKFQPLPLVGLLLLSWVAIVRDARRWAVPAWIAGFVAALYALPYLLLPSGYLARIQETWSRTFTAFLTAAFLDFENLFAFLHNAFGVPFTFAGSQAVSAAIALAFAAFTAAWVLRGRGGEARLPGAMLLSTALGSAFMTALSPLGQNNALILYSPLLITGFVCAVRAETAARARWTAILASMFLGMTLIYSDAVPVDLRNQLRHFALKPVFCLAFGLAIAREAWRRTGAFAS